MNTPRTSKVFQRVGGVHPRRSVFDLSYEKKFTCNMGQLIPIMCDEVVPGDVFMIGNQSLIRFMPLVHPIMHEVNVFVHYFFVPYRILWDAWENFITGGVDGQFFAQLPVWSPSEQYRQIGSLWDFLGFPTDSDCAGVWPLQFPMNAYNMIYNQYYRDETLQGEISKEEPVIQYRAWEKDYFTSALPFQQRGIAPAIPISGTSSAVWSADIYSGGMPLYWPAYQPDDDNFIFMGSGDQKNPLNADTKEALERGYVHLQDLNNNSVDLNHLSTFNVSDLRLAFQIQKWLERNARAGYRYTEFLRAHFGVAPRDERLQRPEYIGGSKSPVIISEVLQTSESATTAQGNLAGHGISISNQFCGKYHAQEFGLIMGIMSVMPRSAYQQGVNRQWLRQTKYDFYFPEFANLSEQAILNGELLAKNGDLNHNRQIFGFQGRYDEMRYKPNMVCGEMRSTFNYWHLGRIFSQESPPMLNSSFISSADIRRDVFADPTEPSMVVQFANIIKAFRPMPIQAEPGLIDHN